ncbi:MAG: CbiX/SirB N-terminal domain-containing protein [Acidimicrobiales bacterium]
MTTPYPESVLAVVLVAHGSRAAEANDAHLAMAADLQRAIDVPVVAAFLELAEPSIPEGIVAAADGGADRVLVLPHFLYPGRHVGQDIPALVDEARARRPGTAIELLGPSGADPALVDLLAAQVRRAAVGDD